MGQGTRGTDDGERELRRRRVVGAALNHGADTGRWRRHARPLPPGA
ncbi:MULTISPECIES: hypothetical protein [unclassified Nocardiopsis]|nr:MULTISPECIES: hypothetical protein [unclassified Nocardiopsis]